jgi:hypothetical protein
VQAQHGVQVPDIKRHVQPIDQIDHVAAVLGVDCRARGQRRVLSTWQRKGRAF